MPSRKHDILIATSYTYDEWGEEEWHTTWYDVYLIHPKKWKYLNGLKSSKKSIYRPQRIATFVTNPEDTSHNYFLDKLSEINKAQRFAYAYGMPDSEILDHLRKSIGCYEKDGEIYCLFNVVGELKRHWW